MPFVLELPMEELVATVEVEEKYEICEEDDRTVDVGVMAGDKAGVDKEVGRDVGLEKVLELRLVILTDVDDASLVLVALITEDEEVDVGTTGGVYVGAHPPLIDGTAFTPVEIGTMLVPQFAAGAIRTLALS